MKYLLFGMLLLCACTSPAPETSNETPEEMTDSRTFLVKKMQAQLGEGAVWDDRSGRLFWVDIEGKMLHLLDPRTGEQQDLPTGERIGTVVPTEDDQAVVALENGIFKMDLVSGKMTLLCDPEKDLPSNRMNDGKCGPAGRLWVGSMHLDQITGAASLYRIEPDGNWEKMVDSVSISNGICWSLDHNKMYYIDTPTGEVMCYDYDLASGDISNGKTCVTVSDTLGYPDGMTIDAEGMLWIALWNGNAVSRWDPATGELLQKIEFPAHNVTSCAFGGANLDTLYVTSARVDMTEEEMAKWPLSGSVFGVVPGVKGVRAFRFGGKF